MKVKYSIILPHIILTPPIEVYPPTNIWKFFVPTKFWQIFKFSPPIIMGGAETMFVFFIKIESNKCFSKTYSEIEIMWPINSSKDVLSRDSKELFVQRFVKVFCKQPLLIFSMVHSYMDLKVYGLDCMTASGFRVQITGLVVLFKLPSLALKHVPTSIQKP